MMREKLRGRVALVTGAGGGIGRATALILARRGARVIASDIADDRLRDTGELLGSGHRTVVADLEEKSSVDALVQEAGESEGRLDILVNNAAVVEEAGPVVECSEDFYDQVMAVNVKAPFFSIAAAIPLMLTNGGGAIVNVASVLGLVGTEGQSAYCASKGALIQLTRQVAVEYAAEGIRCNAVCPGAIKHCLWPEIEAEDPGAFARHVKGLQPLGRGGTPEEVAGVISFLCEDEASFMQGSVMTVDGGYVAW